MRMQAKPNEAAILGADRSSLTTYAVTIESATAAHPDELVGIGGSKQRLAGNGQYK